MLKPAPQNDDKTSIIIPHHVKNLTVPMTKLFQR